MSGRQGCVPLLAPEGGEYEYAGYSYEYSGGYTGEHPAGGNSGGQGTSGGGGKDDKPKRSKSKKKKEVKPPPGKSRSGYN
ncbi:hypothetical protein RB601_009489 [Gaeumannomyces tritici]